LASDKAEVFGLIAPHIEIKIKIREVVKNNCCLKKAVKTN
jgi:hypothetical protein